MAGIIARFPAAAAMAHHFEVTQSEWNRALSVPKCAGRRGLYKTVMHLWGLVL
jgi:hypothetical protein